ncbi:MAG: YihY/virulence factor BrkB family protein [Oscillatoria sp. PMC 1068.18]|nr:YihY/virulence factor BrkB family protein [Oscillatoria sp. PMC 1076.18]MEC4988150.1 YihY/virulence factor BrkB family protein [Oscillatoria sp. PMC 1068.18]
MSWKTVWDLLKGTFTEWQYKQVSILASSIAYYAVFSLAPLVVITIRIVGMIFGEASAQDDLIGLAESVVGVKGAAIIDTAIANSQAATSKQSPLSLTVNVAILCYGASRVFVQMQRALNRVWDVKPIPKRSIIHYISKRLLSFVMVLIIACLLIFSFAINAFLSYSLSVFDANIPGGDYFWSIINSILSVCLVTILVTLIYQILPDTEVRWRDATVGAIATAILFVTGQFLFGLFLGQSDLGSVYGVAGSLVIFITWVYFSAHIFLLGAEFTQVYARKRGSPIVPAPHAVSISTYNSNENSSETRSQRESEHLNYQTAFVGCYQLFLQLWRRLRRKFRR